MRKFKMYVMRVSFRFSICGIRFNGWEKLIFNSVKKFGLRNSTITNTNVIFQNVIYEIHPEDFRRSQTERAGVAARNNRFVSDLLVSSEKFAF